MEKPINKEQKKMKANKPPFKLCFSKSSACLGQSNIHPCRPPNYVNYVTGKFYSREDQLKLKKNLKETLSTSNAYIQTPKEKYRYPILESQRYGWYSDVTFQIPQTLKNKRFNYRRAMNPTFAHNDRV